MKESISSASSFTRAIAKSDLMTIIVPFQPARYTGHCCGEQHVLDVSVRTPSQRTRLLPEPLLAAVCSRMGKYRHSITPLLWF